MKIHFEKAKLNHKDAIFSWLNEPYIQEFWDNTQAHKDDILNFMKGRKEPSSYANGKYVYWVAKENDHPFALIMTIQESLDEDIDEIKLANLSKTGTSYGMDYMIGDKNYFGKGLGATTLSQFLDYFRSQIDPKADTFLIDPATDNPRAKHVYMKAGFEHIADFMMTGTVSGAGKPHHLFVKRFQPIVQLIEASVEDYPTIQNMARFYAYDMSRDCGQQLKGWEFPKDGLYECSNFRKYLEGNDKHAFLIKIDDELAGFVFVNKLEVMPEVDWNMGEFFIVAKLQRRSIGRKIAKQIFDQFPGEWSVGAIPQNVRALNFWRKVIAEYTHGQFREVEKTSEQLKTSECPDPYPMIIIRFKTPQLTQKTNDIEAMESESDLEGKLYEVLQTTNEEAEVLNDKMDVFIEEQLSFKGQVELFKNYIVKHNTKIIAGIRGVLYLGTCLVINVLFVDEGYRHKGLGHKLLEKMENEAKLRGVKIIHLDTFDFQAKEFYIKHGYEIFGVLTNCPEGHERYYMKKNLA